MLKILIPIIITILDGNTKEPLVGVKDKYTNTYTTIEGKLQTSNPSINLSLISYKDSVYAVNDTIYMFLVGN